jgi:hypothetical protein
LTTTAFAAPLIEKTSSSKRRDARARVHPA